MRNALTDRYLALLLYAAKQVLSLMLECDFCLSLFMAFRGVVTPVAPISH
jgi:hypothetical protein